MTHDPQHLRPDAISDLGELRPGDVMLGPIGGVVPGLLPVGLGQLILGEIFRAGTISIRHAGIVVEASRPRTVGPPFPPLLVEAMPSGARIVEMRYDTHWTPRHAYVRLPEDYPGQAERAATMARAMVGTPYSFASYGALALWKFGVRPEGLARWINRRREVVIPGMSASDITSDIPLALPAEAICSVLVDQAWTLAGKQVMDHGTRPQIVTPGALAGKLLRTPRTVWGFPE